VAAFMLLFNRFVPLAMVILAPIVVNIVAFHVFIDRMGLPVALVLLAIHVYLMWCYRKAYVALFVSRWRPTL